MSLAGMSVSKQGQHIIPSMYLRGFCDEHGMVYTHYKNDLQKLPTCARPEKTARENNFYRLSKPYNSDEIENKLLAKI